MGYFDQVYLNRLNRFGRDFQSRLQGQREYLFERQLKKSIYYVQFDYNGIAQEGELTRYKQDETETLQYLLTRLDLKLPPGTIIMIPKDGEEVYWMVYWLEEIKASGYNRYIVLRMTHFLKWVDRDGIDRSAWSYLYGQEDNMLKDEIKSRSRMDTIYAENLKMSFFITPINEYIRKDDYFEIGEGALKEGYRVTGYDINSSKGVEYVTVDPVYLRDLTLPPKRTADDSEEDFYWLEGGNNVCP